MSKYAYLVVNAIPGIERKRYLELGAGQPGTFSRVRAGMKVGVDVQQYDDRHPVDCLMTTDAFFAGYSTNEPPFDVVFVDACHEAEQVWRDFVSAWRVTRPGGVILLHDLFPACEADTDASRCHDAYKVLLALVEHPFDFDLAVLDEDLGLTVVRRVYAFFLAHFPDGEVMGGDARKRTYADLLEARPRINVVSLPRMVEVVQSWCGV